MATGKSRTDEPTLEDLGIYFAEPFTAAECPKELRDLFQLVHGVQYLRITEFGGYNAINENRVEFETNAAHEYDKWLKRQASALAATCGDPDRADDTETKWVSVLEPIVFFRFDREKEEKTPYHHW